MATRTEMLLKAQEVADYGYLPAGPAAPPKGVPLTETPEGVFCAADLFALEGDEPLAEVVTMPKGLKAWVHPVCDEEALWLNTQAAREAKARDCKDAEEALDWRIRRARAYQVIMACRVGPEAGAERIFHPKHADAVQRNLPLATIETVVSTSDRLGLGADVERQAIADFFAAARTYARTCALRCATGSGLPSDWQAFLEGFASCVSAVQRRGFLIPGDALALQEVVAALPQE